MGISLAAISRFSLTAVVAAGFFVLGLTAAAVDFFFLSLALIVNPQSVKKVVIVRASQMSP